MGFSSERPARAAQPLTSSQANDVLRYWLLSLQLEEALAARPRARRSALRAPSPRLDTPSAGQDYFKVALDAGLGALLCKRAPLHKPFDAELGAFFENWLVGQYRRGEDDRELSHLLAFPVVHLPRGELAGLLRCGLRVRFGTPGGAPFRAPTRSERRRKTFSEPPCEVRLIALERSGQKAPFFIDTRLLHQQLGVTHENIDAFFAALRAQPSLSEVQMLTLVCELLEREQQEADGDDSAARTQPASGKEPALLLTRLTAAVAGRLAQRGAARVYPVGIVLDGTRAKTTWHLQRELQALLEDSPEVAWETDSCLGSYLTGGALPAGMALQRALFPGVALSPSQRAAAERVWGSRLTAVQGPPGTGKTTLILHLAAEALVRQIEALADRGVMTDALMVVTSTNNRAVDNVVDAMSSAAADGLPLAIRGGSQKVCEHVLAPQLARARAWLVRAQQLPAAERERALEDALDQFQQVRAQLGERFAPRARAFEAEAERERLRRELARLPQTQGSPDEPEVELDVSTIAKLEPLLAAARKRLQRLCELCEKPPGLPQLSAVARQYQSSAKRALPALEEGLVAAGLPFALGLPPNLPPSTVPSELMSVWQEAAESALTRVEDLQERLGRVAVQRKTRERKRQLERRLEALGPDVRLSESEALGAEHEPLQRALFGAAVAAREAWAAANAEYLVPALHAAVDAAQVECSMRSLWTDDDDDDHWGSLRQLFGVWGCTLLSMGNCFPMERDSIERVIIDEAGQCHPTYAVSGLMRSRSALIIGDVHQLEPVIDLEPDDDERLIQACKLGSRVALLEPYRVHSQARNSVQVLADRAVLERPCLTDHFRCQPEIIAICDALCQYGLRVHTPSEGPRAPLPFLQHPVSLVDVAGEQQRLGGSWYNAAELDVTLELFLALQRAGIDPRDIVIITPYRGQLEQLHRRCARQGIPIDASLEFLDLEDKVASAARGVALGTVHRFQGGERSIVLFTSVVTRRTSLGFLDDRENLLNVAISRARHHFITIGSRAVLEAGRRTGLLAQAAQPLAQAAFRTQLGLHDVL